MLPSPTTPSPTALLSPSATLFRRCNCYLICDCFCCVCCCSLSSSSSSFYHQIITVTATSSSSPSYCYRCYIIAAVSVVVLWLLSLPWTPSTPPVLPPAHRESSRSPRGDSSFLLPSAQLPPLPVSSLNRELLLHTDGCLVSLGKLPCLQRSANHLNTFPSTNFR